MAAGPPGKEFQMTRRTTLSLTVLALAFVLAPWPGGGGARAAAGSGSGTGLEIPVPKTQRKIGVEQAKDFAEGKISVKMLAAGRTSAEVSVNDGPPSKLATGALTLLAVGEDAVCTLTYLGKSGAKGIVAARCDPATEELRAALEAQRAAQAEGGEAVSPLDLVADTAKGGLKNPYTDNPQAIAEGRRLFLANSCNGCHGGTGGGGMGPPLSNAVWVYGPDDDTLFRLLAKGTEELQAEGYTRIARERVVGPMPPFGEIIESSEQLWKIIAFVRSIYNDDPSKKTW